MIVRMKRILTRTVWALTKQLAAGDFKPSLYELRFGNGKIDRVDTCEDGDKVYVKVIDYKTGSKAFDVSALYHGLQLRLMVYMDAAVKDQEKQRSDKEIVPAGVFYYRINDPLVEKQPEEQVEEAVLKELKPDGIIHLKDEVLNHLDHCMSGESSVIPVKYNKDGSLSKTSRVISSEAFETMMDYAVRKIEKTREQILDGEIDVNPYRRGQESGCDYCSFRHVCGFDTKISGYRYRDIRKMSMEEAVQAMQAEEKGEQS